MSANNRYPGPWEYYVLTETPNFSIELTHYTPATYRTQRVDCASLNERHARFKEIVVDLLNQGWEPVTEGSFKRPFSD